MAGCQIADNLASSPEDSVALDAQIQESLSLVRSFMDPFLSGTLTNSSGSVPRLLDAIRHVLLAPGKRLRPALTLWAASACGGTWESAASAATAVEMIHAYSLVHDDLPAMDDDDLRRGQPTCHRAFDEATAILCGDALQAFAYEILAKGMPKSVAGDACVVLAQAAGKDALVGGQMDDLAAERGWIEDMTAAPTSEKIAWLERIHSRKTGALFSAALELGALAAGGSDDQRAALSSYGHSFGLAFQIADDLLDVEGSEVSVGKRVGKDAARGKLTFPSILGVEASRKRALTLANDAASAISKIGAPAEDLVRLAFWIVSRNH
ncbi:MAG: polyprenyl synthetase family protein [Pirellulales bacterium]